MRNMFAAAAALLFLVLSLETSPALARDLPAAGMTREQVAGWLRDRGYPAEIKTDSTSGDTYVSSTVDGVTFGIYLYGCDGDVCPDIQYSAGWTGLSAVTPDQINVWNRDNRYVRAYVSKEGGVFGEYDVDIAAGGTWEQLNHSLDRWVQALDAFKAFLNP